MIILSNNIIKRFVALSIATIMLVGTICFVPPLPANAASEASITFDLITNAGIPDGATLVLTPYGGPALSPVTIYERSASVIVDNEFEIFYNVAIVVNGFVAATGEVIVPAGYTDNIPITIDVAAPRVTVSPELSSIRFGHTETFIATAVGLYAQNESTFAFQWYRNGIAIGGNSATLTTPVLTLGDDGDVFSVAVTGYNNQETRVCRTVTVNRWTPTLTLDVPENHVLPGRLTLTATLSDVYSTVRRQPITFTVIDQSDNSTVVEGTILTNNSGVATFSFTPVYGVMYTFIAVFEGCTNNNEANIEIRDINFQRGVQAPIIITGIDSPIMYGDSNINSPRFLQLNYNQNAPRSSSNVVFSITPSSDVASISPGGLLEIHQVGSFTIRATRMFDDNYNTVFSEVDVTVVPRTLTVDIAIEDRHFDGFTDASVSGVNLMGVVPGDENYVNLHWAIEQAYFEHANVGNNIPVNLIGSFSISGARHENYILMQPTTSTFGNIINEFAAVRGVHYTITALNAGWTSHNFVITAQPGFLISLTADDAGDWEDQLASPNTGTWQTSIAFPHETSGHHITFYVRCILTSRISQDVVQTIRIDRQQPSINRFDFTRTDNTPFQNFVNILTFGLFFHEEINVSVVVNNVPSGIGVIQAYAHPDGGTPQPLEIVSFDARTRTAIFTLPVGFQGIVSAYVTSNAGNRSIQVPATTANSNLLYARIQIEDIAPTIHIDVAPAVHIADGKAWHTCDVPMTITVGDADSGIRSVEVRMNDVIIAQDMDGRAIDANFFEYQTHEEVFLVHTSQGIRAADGSYRVDVTVIDNAGNIYTSTRTVFVDDIVPVISGFSFKPEGIQEANNQYIGIEITDYGFFFAQNTKIIISAYDGSPSAGIRSITYFTVCVDGGRSTERTVYVTDNQISFIIPADFKGQIYARATDNVNHTATYFVTPSSVIIASPDRHAVESNIMFNRPATTFTDVNGLDLYANSVNVSVNVVDNFAGLRRVEWTVIAPHDTANNQHGMINIANDGTLTGNTDGWSTLRTDRNLVTELDGILTVNNNSNAIAVWVRITDRAGNTSEETIYFSIDTSIPTISVTYNNNSPDSTHTSYFNADRIATIVITERNFRPENVNISITNSEGIIPTVSAWTTVVNTANPDLTTHTATLTFSADGVYTWSINFHDNANNAAASFGPDTFTIDQTDPTITVTFDNNDAVNVNYFNAARIATISITERNFDPNRVTITGTSTDGGAPIAFPATSGWSSVGDVRTANINFDIEGMFSFEVAVTDMAGNVAMDYSVSTFYIDLTPPVLIGYDETAYDGTLSIYRLSSTLEPARILVFEDTNMSHIIYTITAYSYIEGEENGGITIFEMAYTEIFTNRRVNGDTVSLPPELFQHNGVYEVRATAYDMAGNSSGEIIHTYVVMRGIDMMAYVPHQVLEEFNGIHKQAINFPDIPIRIFKIDSAEFDVSIGEVRLITGDYEEEIVGRVNRVTEHVITIPNTFIARTFNEDAQVYDLPINVSKNPLRTVARMVINNVPPSGVFEPLLDLRDGRGFYGVDEQEIQVIHLSEGIDKNTTIVSVNGVNIPFIYNADTATISFMLERSPAYGHPWAGHDIRVTLVDTAGNEYTLEEVRNIYVGSWFGRHWIFFIAGGILLIGSVTIVCYWIRHKKKMDD